MLRMRINFKFLMILLSLGVAFTLFTFWAKCGDSLPGHKHNTEWRQYTKQYADTAAFYHLDGEYLEKEDGLSLKDGQLHVHNDVRTLDKIECLINEEYTVSCRQDDEEVYVPFSFLHKYFEVYGKIVKHNGHGRFEWQHSYSKVYFPKEKYDPYGVFLWFEYYNVEVRERVKCISGIEGVPVSTQWDPSGHFYPIQIAQFGLSHFSKNLTKSAPSIVILEDGEGTSEGHWAVPDEGVASLKKIIDETTRNHVLLFRSSDSEDFGITLTLNEEIHETVLSFDLKLTSNGSVTVVLVGSGKHYYLHYVVSNSMIFVQGNQVFYNIGQCKEWIHITRDLIIDLYKGFSLIQNNKKPSKIRNVWIRSIVLTGSGYIDNITISSSSHVAHFYAAADWLVKQQDDLGGWPIMVTRKLSSGMLELAPGWYSAMAQGQAMSLLTRAFKVTGNLKYLNAAIRAIRLFKIRSENHGIMTTFLGRYVWYEEYPTIPSSFVLNGFIYSLVGLYDLKTICNQQDCQEASELFDDGMVSLKKMVPLFDTGSGSVYDLRHFSLGVSPNLARWDYHTTHINQLLFLSTVDSDPVLKSTAERWIGYMKGRKASHN